MEVPVLCGEDPSLLLKSVRRPMPPPATSTRHRDPRSASNAERVPSAHYSAPSRRIGSEKRGYNLDYCNSQGWVGKPLTVRGKGRKDRMLPVPSDLMTTITEQCNG